MDPQDTNLDFSSAIRRNALILELWHHALGADFYQQLSIDGPTGATNYFDLIWTNGGHRSACTFAAASALHDEPLPLALAQGYKEEGNQHATAGRHQEAISAYTKAINLSPLGIFYRNRCLSYMQIDNWQEAQVDGEQAVERDPQNHLGWTRLARVLLHNNYIDEARAAVVFGIMRCQDQKALQTTTQLVQELGRIHQMTIMKDAVAKKNLATLESAIINKPTPESISARLSDIFKGDQATEMLSNPRVLARAAEMMKDPTRVKRILEGLM